MSESPAEVLRAAARKLDDLAAAATPGPWAQASAEEMGHGYNPSVLGKNGQWVAEAGPERGIDAPDGNGTADSAWMAALNPAVAPALSAWLRAEADVVAVAIGHGIPQRDDTPALAFARALLGEDTPDADAR